MDQGPDRKLTAVRGTGTASESVANVAAVIRETRARLEMRFIQARHDIKALLSGPPAQWPESHEPGLLPFAVNALVGIRRRTHVWRRAWQHGLLRKATIGSTFIAVAVVLVVSTRRRFNSRKDRSD